MSEDTIAAIATGISSGGIGIIRVSGEDAVPISDSIFFGAISLSDASTHQVLYGHIKDSNGIIDEVLITKFLSPRSYTREDVVEISSHGGSFVMRKILGLLFEKGARPASPGEFTKRAFLNGRIDLAQAESVMDIISAENDFSLSNSIKQLDGELSNRIKSLRSEILHESAYIEAALDDPEHYDLTNFSDLLHHNSTKWKSIISSLIDSFRQGRILKNGIRTAIVGRPNAGKSSLLNALSKSDRAIVTEIPGTTRDTIEEKVRFFNHTLLLIDTAGIRNTDNPIEQIGVERSIDAISTADLVFYMLDINQPMSNADIDIIKNLDFQKTIPILNKIDLMESEQNAIANYVKSAKDFLDKNNIVFSWINNSTIISAKNRLGFEDLDIAITEKLGLNNSNHSTEIMITNERHAGLLRAACRSLNNLENTILDGLPEDFYTVDLMDAYASLGFILGEEVEDDLVESIFKEFCMGK